MREFYRWCLYTLLAVYILIFVGGIVRSTGSGMGCPDWPQCFGNWLPPVDIRELPPNYKHRYAEYRRKKNVKFARYLHFVGIHDVADALLKDKKIYEEADFNIGKTWTEYINRLMGMGVGVLITLLFVKAFRVRIIRPSIFILSIILFLAVIFQGWFGSIVISSNLTSWTVTVHMFMALFMVALLVFLLHLSRPIRETKRNKHIFSVDLLLPLALVLTLAQIFMGTQVRGEVDHLAALAVPRLSWIADLGVYFNIHRSFVWIIFLINLLLFFMLRKMNGLRTLSNGVMVLILILSLTGVSMAYWAIPAWLQPIHLLLASIIFGLQSLMVCRYFFVQDTT